MSSRRSVRHVVGRQVPTRHARPEKGLLLDDVDDAIELSSRYGLVPDEWQEWVLDGWLARNARTGRLASSQCGLTVPRQNGKNGCLEIVELFKIVVLGRRILHTAHEVKTARKAFMRLASFFENERQWPELAALVKEIRRTNGQEALVLTNGGSVEFIARSKGSGRGFTVDDLVLDEAQELGEDALAALLPTISAAPSGDPQIIFTGTPPGPTMNGEVFTRVRTNALKGKNRRACWDEWSIVEGADLDDIAAIAEANPALGGRLQADVCVDERAAMDDETYARERGGLWSEERSAGRAISWSKWVDCRDDEHAYGAAAAIGLGGSVDGAFASVGAASEVDGRLEVGVVDRRHGSDWVVAEAARIQSERGVDVAIDKGGPLSHLIPRLEDAGVRLTTLGTSEYLDACAGLWQHVEDASLVHVGAKELDDAVKVATWRSVGDRRAFGRKSGDISMLEAVTLAAHVASVLGGRSAYADHDLVFI